MIGRLCGSALILIVRAYQKIIRPFLPATCIFQPGCSDYMVLAIKKYGPIRGVPKGLWRICRCHPFNAGGSDPP